MPRAVLKNGAIHPLEPLPSEWSDGRELWVEEAVNERVSTPEEIDRWYQELEAMCSQNNPEDDARLQAAIDRHRREQKELMRRRMGLS